MRKIIWGLVIVIVLAFVGIVYIVKKTDHKLANSDGLAPTANQATQNQQPTTTPEQSTSTPLSLPVKYDNTEYGFVFSLSTGWQGYSVYTKQWAGCSLNGTEDCSKAIKGPEIFIRNPNWSEQNPYEDIPVMVFTIDQWNQIQQDKLSVSAAPFPPSELGRNQKYVFALPSRYDYDFKTGFEEVEKIMQSNPLRAY
jgi:hypothetical protein